MAGLITDLIQQATTAPSNTSLPAWLKDKQAQAVKQLADCVDPDRKSENWRYTDAKRLQLTDLVSSIVNEEEETEEADGVVKVTVRIHENGFDVSQNCPDSLKITSIFDVAETDWQDIAFDQEKVVNLLNTASFNHGVNVSLGSDWNNDNLQLIIENDFAESKQWRYIRNQININKNQQLKLVESTQSGHVNVVNVFAVETNGVLERKQKSILNSSQKIVSYNQFDLADNAVVKSINQHFDGLLQHHMHFVNFNGQKSEFKMGTVNKGFNDNNIADLVQVNHNFENNQSDVTHRSIADDQSQIFTNAKAYVAVGADQSEIEQDLKNILLSPDAKIFSKPELEVYADEVIAAHGSTIGALDEQSLFYLQSRGISIKQARSIMIESFEQEAIAC